MPLLGSSEPESLRQAGEHLLGGMNVLSLLQQGIPGNSDV